MKLVKSLLLGSAAGLVAVAGASAADLAASRPAAADVVRVCPQYGAGFFVVPGTTSCLKLIGRVRVETLFNNDLTRDSDKNTIRARGYFGYDHRTATEYGLLRTYVRGFVGRDNATTAAFNLEYAFIQFGGLTVGRTGSVYEHGYANLFNGSGSYGGFSDVAYVNSIGYTFQFGGGFSASLALDAARERQVNLRPSVGTTTTTYTITDPGSGPVADPDDYVGPTIESKTSTVYPNQYAGQAVPDIVGALDYAGSWGSAKLAGAIHQLRALDGAVDTKYGFAIGGNLKVNLPMISAGSNIWANANYTDGASSYAGFGTSATIGRRIYNFNDGVVVGNSIETTKAYSFAGGLEVFATPTVRLGLYGTYAQIDPSGSSNTITTGSVFGQVAWLPVSGFLVGGEVGYVSARASANANIGGVETASRSQDNWTGRIRFQRDF